jgi:PAS domain S-box-containing protein
VTRNPEFDAAAGDGSLAGRAYPGEQFLQTILDTVASLVTVLDREGRIVLFNRACERVTGYTFEEVRGKHPWDMLLLPEDVEKVRGVFGKLRAGQSNSYDNCWRTKDGRVREIAWTNTILGDEDGNVRFVVPTGIDVTERRVAERRLVESEHLYRVLFSSAHDAIYLCDGGPANGFRLLEANEEASRRLLYTRAEFLERGMLDIHPPETWAACGDAVARLRADGGVIFETTERRRDGTVVPVEVSAHLFDLQGKPVVLAISRDLSERKRLEEQLAQASKLEAIGRLSGGVAHDFNNLLVVILSGSNAIREALPDDSPLREDAEQILQAGRKAAALTQQLLAFGRKRVVRPVTLDLNSVIDEMARLLRRLVGEEVQVETRLAPAPCTVVADAAGIQQVIVNLAVNARDAMPRGGRITITTESAEISLAAAGKMGIPPGRHVVLSVRDTGVGMSADVRQRIFEPFFTTKEEGRGTGLGLATVFGTIKQAGGHVVVESAPGAGACFKVYLPQRSDAPAAPVQAPRPARARGDGRTLLVVEDDPAVLGIVVRMLEDEGYRVLATGDPREAVKIAEMHGGRIDALLTDVIMPHLNGRELADRVRAARPGMGLVCMSGYTNDFIAKSGFLEEGLLFVDKPFSRDELLDKVAEAVSSAAAITPAPPGAPAPVPA